MSRILYGTKSYALCVYRNSTFNSALVFINEFISLNFLQSLYSLAYCMLGRI